MVKLPTACVPFTERVDDPAGPTARGRGKDRVPRLSPDFTPLRSCNAVWPNLCL